MPIIGTDKPPEIGMPTQGRPSSNMVLPEGVADVTKRLLESEWQTCKRGVDNNAEVDQTQVVVW